MTQDRRFLITGAATGIGREVDELAANEGAAVFLVDPNEERLSEVRLRARTSWSMVAASQMLYLRLAPARGRIFQRLTNHSKTKSALKHDVEWVAEG